MDKITLEEHKELGRNLKRARLKMLLSKKNFDKKAVNLIDKLRDILEEVMVRDYDTFENFTHVYYGKTE